MWTWTWTSFDSRAPQNPLPAEVFQGAVPPRRRWRSKRPQGLLEVVLLRGQPCQASNPALITIPVMFYCITPSMGSCQAFL